MREPRTGFIAQEVSACWSLCHNDADVLNCMKVSGLRISAASVLMVMSACAQVTTNLDLTNVWRYSVADLDGLNWQTPNFDDSAWLYGPGIFWTDVRGDVNPDIPVPWTEVGFLLQQADSLNGSWADVPGPITNSPYSTTASHAAQYFRLRK